MLVTWTRGGRQIHWAIAAPLVLALFSLLLWWACDAYNKPSVYIFLGRFNPFLFNFALYNKSEKIENMSSKCDSNPDNIQISPSSRPGHCTTVLHHSLTRRRSGNHHNDLLQYDHSTLNNRKLSKQSTCWICWYVTAVAPFMGLSSCTYLRSRKAM